MAIEGKTNIRDLIPLGSVVNINGLERKFMIIRYFYKASKEMNLINGEHVEPNQVFDYLCVLWPDGDVNPDKRIFFNHDAIDSVHFYGYVNDESIEFKNDLENEINRTGAQNGG